MILKIGAAEDTVWFPSYVGQRSTIRQFRDRLALNARRQHSKPQPVAFCIFHIVITEISREVLYNPTL